MDLPQFAFFKGRVVSYPDAKVGLLTHTLNYGTAYLEAYAATGTRKSGSCLCFARQTISIDSCNLPSSSPWTFLSPGTTYHGRCSRCCEPKIIVAIVISAPSPTSVMKLSCRNRWNCIRTYRSLPFPPHWNGVKKACIWRSHRGGGPTTT